MLATHTIHAITFDKNFICLQIDGQTIKVALDKVSVKLKTATDTERNHYKISPSGYGIHWSLIDEDLSVDALLKVAVKN
jgi:hypothetical protein